MNSAGLAEWAGPVTSDMLRATFDHWRIFFTHGKWWAIRPGEVAGGGPRSLIHSVVGACTLEALGDQLSMQEWLRALPARELEAVWRGGFTAVRP